MILKMKKYHLIALLLGLILSIMYFLIPHLNSDIIDSKETSDIMALETAVKLFRLHTGRYPTDDEGLGVLILPPKDIKDRWKGPYIDKDLTDRWNRAYSYKTHITKDGEPFRVYSFGENGIDEKCKGDDFFVQ